MLSKMKLLLVAPLLAVAACGVDAQQIVDSSDPIVAQTIADEKLAIECELTYKGINRLIAMMFDLQLLDFVKAQLAKDIDNRAYEELSKCRAAYKIANNGNIENALRQAYRAALEQSRNVLNTLNSETNDLLKDTDV
jgi:hypothetical protein